MRKMLLAPVLAAALCFAGVSVFPADAAPAVICPEAYITTTPMFGPGMMISVADVTRINVPETAEVLIVLEANRSETQGLLKLFSKETAGDGSVSWKETLMTMAGIGKNGLYKETEGDNKTPVGIFRMNTPFGIKEALPGFPSNYKKVTDQDYWNGDSSSSGYNSFVTRTEDSTFNTEDSEHLVEYPGDYNYAVDTGYNPEHTPHRGSGIFLHCLVGDGNGTHGCIAVPEQDMITILKNYREGNTYIAVIDRASPEAAYR